MGSCSFPLAKQSSIYSLTFEELQSTHGLGKDLGSMNLEDLLKNIWTAEDSQTLASSTGVGDGSMAAGNLQRQGSLILPRTHSQKTVDEVWRDFQNETTVGSNLGQKQSTLGEMTLEEFLVRAGLVTEDKQPTGTSNNVGFTGVLGQVSIYNNNAVNISFQQPTQSLGLLSYQFAESSMLNVHSVKSFQQQPQQQQTIPEQMNVAFASPMQLRNHCQLASPRARTPVISTSSRSVNTTIVQGDIMQDGVKGMAGLRSGVMLTPAKGGSPGNRLSSDMISRDNLSRSSLSPSPYAFNEGGRGRRSCSSLEKAVERRRKRMIKNRESAARSRARKQAYTLELEAEVAKLKEINEELQEKQAEFMDMQKNQLLEKLNMSWGSKLRCLRRTLTGPW